MNLLYNLLFAIGLVILSPFYLYRLIKRGNYREGFFQRFGFFAKELRAKFGERGGVWIRAVSVGEVAEALVIIEQLRRQRPQMNIALSVTTSTGYQVAKKRAPADVAVSYYPIDFGWCVARALDCFRPQLIVLVESDIWPNLMRQAAARHIPVALINARISEKSLRGYLRAQFLFKPAFRRLALACAPDETAARRLAQLGVSLEKTHTVGSLKYEVAALSEKKNDQDPAALLKAAGASPTAPVLVAGSTHPGEEEIFLDLLPRLRRQFPGLFLVLAPRHAERGAEVAQLAERKSVACVRRTTLKSEFHNSKSERNPQSEIQNPKSACCLLLDTTGELRAFYRVATVIFVGKSLVGHGGQNILEAVITGNAVVFGPHMENFEAIAQEILSAGAAVQVSEAIALEAAIRDLLVDEKRRAELGARAREVFERNLGAAGRTTDLLLNLLGGEQL
jgi:3-deoxy-D-manno-octulosonic-acid transferase